MCEVLWANCEPECCVVSKGEVRKENVRGKKMWWGWTCNLTVYLYRRFVSDSENLKVHIHKLPLYLAVFFAPCVLSWQAVGGTV